MRKATCLTWQMQDLRRRLHNPFEKQIDFEISPPILAARITASSARCVLQCKFHARELRQELSITSELQMLRACFAFLNSLWFEAPASRLHPMPCSLPRPRQLDRRSTENAPCSATGPLSRELARLSRCVLYFLLPCFCTCHCLSVSSDAPTEHDPTRLHDYIAQDGTEVTKKTTYTSLSPSLSFSHPGMLKVACRVCQLEASSRDGPASLS